MKYSLLPAFFVLSILCFAQKQQGSSPALPLDLSKTPTLYVVGYAHLDTQWRWEYPKTIREYLPDTLHKNFDLFEKYPHYIFNFSGSNRYRMMKEYYPADFLKLQSYVQAGRWFPAGSSVEESDVNTPSAESILRQVLYGNEFFRREFGRSSSEYMLPDCFGFPASLPSLLAHARIKGFSTQKLTWHSAAQVGGPDSPEKTPVGIPFNLGFWTGPDGRGVIAALNPGDYVGRVTYDLSKSDPQNTARDYVDWPKRIDVNAKASGLFTDYHYYGTGDVGGSPAEASVKFVDAIASKGRASSSSSTNHAEGSNPTDGEAQMGDGPLRIVSSTAEQMFLDITPAQAANLPRYSGDLELIEHSAGSLTSQAYRKRWNRKNELLADAAERASVIALQAGARSYPQERLNNAWTLVMGGQFHDIMAGTATPRAYEYSWNDDVLAMNQFAAILTSATEGVAAALDTRGKGIPIVVYNPLNIAREDVVEASVAFANGAPQAVRVYGPDGKEVLSQLETEEGNAKVLFLASVPAIGYAVYQIEPVKESATGESKSSLSVNELRLLENSRYRVRLDQTGNGELAGIFDKSLGKELLSAPMRLALQTEKPHDWPAWNMDWTDQNQPPRAYVGGIARVTVAENGPVRVALRVERETEGSKFVQIIRLAAGEAGNRVEFANKIDWKTSAAALKSTIPLTASNPVATYNWDVGTVQRGNNTPTKYEVASHQWFDLTDKSGAYGVTVLSDCKYGSDKPDDSTLRLTLIYTPGLGQGNGRDFSDQITQDWGHHEFVYGIAGHAGDWRTEQSDWQALRLNQPLIAFTTSSHPGALGKVFSFLHLNNNRLRVLALKKAERSDEVILRMVEMDGKAQENVQISFASPVIAAREVDGQEMPLNAAKVLHGALVTSFDPYQLRTFAVKVGRLPASTAPKFQAIKLSFDRTVASKDGSKSANASSGFDSEGRALPAELLPAKINYGGISFSLATSAEGIPLAAVPKGETVSLPVSSFKRLYLLAASAAGDQKVTFRVGDNPIELTIQDWSGFIGQWDDRTWNQKEEQLPPRPGAAPNAPPRVRTVLEYTGLNPGFVKQAPVAWFASHRHTAGGDNEPYAYSYLFAYEINIPAGARTLILPSDDRIRILAITASDEANETRPAQPLYDTLER
jgi:alpha-mannosidase